MNKNRIEAFSDGVIAIIITIMVLELKIPEGNSFTDLFNLWPKFFGYILSFIYIAVFWNNHHHLLKASFTINGKIMWSNVIFLFSLSLLPFSTGWLSESHFSQDPSVVYGINLLLCGLSYLILQKEIIKGNGSDLTLKISIGKDIKGKISPLITLLGIILSILSYPYFGVFMYFSLCILWFLPDRRLLISPQKEK
jgi:uncharacterized membrane protein